MKTTTALILEASDFTKDSNLKKEAFDAFAKAELVVHEGRVIKTGAALVAQAAQEPVKRVRRVKATKPLLDAPQAVVEPIHVPTPTNEDNSSDGY